MTQPMTRADLAAAMAAKVAARPSAQGRPKWPRHGRTRARRQAQRLRAIGVLQDSRTPEPQE